jgi:drug/metabolite transporter (DMT)-like permease
VAAAAVALMLPASRRNWTRRTWAVGAAYAMTVVLFIAGLSLFVVSPGEAVATAPNPPLGNILALASGVAWAATLLGLRGMGRGDGGMGAAAGATVAGNSSPS